MPKSLFLDLGGFFEGYKNGCEDVDLCLRLGRLGYQLKCLPASCIYHLESQSEGRKNYDEGNGRLLMERCAGLFVPDVHLHGLKDGFVPYVTDTLDLVLRMQEAEERKLLTFFKDKPWPELKELLCAHPLFVGGRLLLAAQAEAAENYALAWQLRCEVAVIVQSKEAYLACLRLARYAPEASRQFLSDVEAELKIIEELSFDQSRWRLILREIKRSRDKYLIRLYEEKILALKDAFVRKEKNTT